MQPLTTFLATPLYIVQIEVHGQKTWKWEKLKREEPAMRHRKQECDVILIEKIKKVKRRKISVHEF